MALLCCFFFSSRRRHTRWPRDWSSDVCSSDLGITTASLLKQYDWIKTGVVLMGSPNLVDFGNLLIKDFNKTAKNQISLNEKEKELNKLKPFDVYKDIESLNN